MSREEGGRHCLSFDVEEHFQVAAFSSHVSRSQWDDCESRVERNMHRLLDILAARRICATFFVLGWVAQRHPRLVRDIVRHGHEVASHGFYHEMITVQSPEAFRQDIRKSKAVLEELAGLPVLGYRAPTFSITAKTKWALPILVEEGYVYDSSIFPVRHDRYGMPEADPGCHQLMTSAGALWEVPPSTMALGGMRIPVAGGGYFRLFPYAVMKRMLRRVEREGRPLVLYLHPWEIDPTQPRMSGPILSQFRHYLNLDKTESRLIKLLDEFEFAPIRETIPAIHELWQCRSIGSAVTPCCSRV